MLRTLHAWSHSTLLTSLDAGYYHDPILQMKELRLKEVTSLTQDHTARRWGIPRSDPRKPPSCLDPLHVSVGQWFSARVGGNFGNSIPDHLDLNLWVWGQCIRGFSSRCTPGEVEKPPFWRHHTWLAVCLSGVINPACHPPQQRTRWCKHTVWTWKGSVIDHNTGRPGLAAAKPKAGCSEKCPMILWLVPSPTDLSIHPISTY